MAIINSRRTKIFFNLALLLMAVMVFSAPVSAQTGQKVEIMLTVPAIDWAAAASFVLEAADHGIFSDSEAFLYAKDRNWLPKNAVPEENARLNGISLLLMESFNLKGGIMYSIFTNPHFAYRELVYRRIIQGRSDPTMVVSGEELLFLTSKFLSIREMEEERAEIARRQADQELQRLAREREEREALAREINARLEAQRVADTTARATDTGVTISLSRIQFLANSTELADSERIKIQEIARILETIPERNILVAGHTALAGTRAAQQQTSLERARSVANYLISLGVRTSAEITVRGYGADQPIADNTTEEGMAMNRRVEITILQTGGR